MLKGTGSQYGRGIVYVDGTVDTVPPKSYERNCCTEPDWPRSICFAFKWNRVANFTGLCWVWASEQSELFSIIIWFIEGWRRSLGWTSFLGVRWWRHVDRFRLSVGQRNATDFANGISPDLDSPGLQDLIAGVSERVSVDHMAVVIAEGQVDRGHTDTSEIDVLPDELPIRLQLRGREQHPARTAARVIDRAPSVEIRRFRRQVHLSNHVADRFRGHELAPFTVRDSTLKQIAENVLTGFLGDADERGEHLCQLVDSPLSLGPLFVFLDRLQILLLHQWMPQGADGHVQKILKCLTATDSGSLRYLFKLIEERFRIGVEKGFLGQE